MFGILCQRCLCGFRRNFCPMRFGGLRIFLLLNQVDLVVHFTNSTSEILEATVEIRILYGEAPLESSCMSSSQYRKWCVVENDCV